MKHTPTPWSRGGRMTPIRLKNTTYYWNPFWGFFVLPVSPTRKRERIVKSGWLYNSLKSILDGGRAFERDIIKIYE